MAFAFKPRSQSRKAVIQASDTLTSIALRESVAGDEITAEDIARFNFGSADPHVVQECLRDWHGATQRTSQHEFALDPADDADRDLFVPERYSADGFETGVQHKLALSRPSCPPQFLACGSASEVCFGFDSSFVQPDAKPQLQAMADVAEEHPDGRLFLFGHTDSVGDPMYNKKLSERRAWAVYAFFIKDVDAWEVIYDYEDWGLVTVQTILAALGFDPGAIDGDMGPATRGAMRRFLGLGEEAPVSNDAAFRAQLFEAYMTGENDPALPAGRFIDDGFMGCGEFNLAEMTDAKESANRRVALYVFNPERLPRMPCAFADLGPCNKRFCAEDTRFNLGFSCSFYDTIAEPCGCETPQVSVSILIDVDGPDPVVLAELHDTFELRSTCGRMTTTQPPDAAIPYDATRVELRWEHVRPHMTLSLIHKLGGAEIEVIPPTSYSGLMEDGYDPREDPFHPYDLEHADKDEQ